MKDRLITFSDLMTFCKNQGIHHFSFSNTGCRVFVQVPSILVYESEKDNLGLMRLKIKIMHLGLNRNGSFISEDKAKNMLHTIKNRPILANIHQLEDGTWDFGGHDMEIINNDGQLEYHYIERQVGSFTEDEPFLEYDEELDKTYICAYGIIPEEYTRAASIIRDKNGTKNSCELAINEFSYDAKHDWLSLDDFYLSASTLLGKNDEGIEIKEGMEGSRADICEFESKDVQIIDTVDKMQALTLSDCNTNFNQRKEDNTMETNEILTNEEDNFEDDIVEINDEENDTDDTVVEEDAVESEETPEDDEDNINADGTFSSTISYSVSYNGNNKVFELSLDDIQQALHDLINTTYGESDNAWYSVTVFDNYVIMQDWFSNRAYKQNYVRDEDNFSLKGDRSEVFAHWLTEEESQAIDDMRANYSSISESLKAYQDKEALEQKTLLLNSEDYSIISQNTEFVSLRENMDNYSLDELSKEADLILAKAVKAGTVVFSEKKQTKTKIGISAISENSYSVTHPYGNLFDNI